MRDLQRCRKMGRLTSVLLLAVFLGWGLWATVRAEDPPVEGDAAAADSARRVADERGVPARPEALLAVREGSPAGELVAELEGEAERLAVTLQELGERKLLASDIGAMNAAYKQALRLQQAGQLLSVAREVAGADLQARGSHAVEQLKKWSTTIKGQPDFSRIQGRLTKEFISETKAREKKLNRVRSLLKQAKSEEAQVALRELFDDLAAGALWVDPSIYEAAERMFEKDQRDVDEAVKGELREKAEASLNELPERKTPDVRGLSQEIQQALTALETQETVEFRGEKRTGPELLREISRSLASLQAQIVRHDIARLYAAGTREAQAAQLFEVTRAEFPKWVTKAVRADAARLGGNLAKARTRYAEYLAVLAPEVALSESNALLDELNAAVGAFKAIPELDRELLAYEQATDPLLDWRERTAEAQAKAARNELMPLEVVFREASSQARLPGVGGEEQPEPLKWGAKPGLVQDPVPLVRVSLNAALADRGVLLKHALPVAGSAGVSQTPLAKGLYAELPVTPVPAPLIARLERDLLVGPKRPPLSLRAATALWGLRNGVVLEVGGRTNAVELEAPGPRWLNVAADDLAFVNAGPLVTSQVVDFERQVLARVRVQPSWYRYRYQFRAGP